MKRSGLAVICLFLLLYIVPLGYRPLIIPDESRYAEIPREMIASGDWIVPHLNGLRYFEKPVLGYWITAGSILIFGENAFAVRLPSALAAGISAMLLFYLLWKFREGYAIGLFAASLFLTFIETFAIGTFNTLDSLLSMFLTAAMVGFFFAHMEERPLKKTVLFALFGVFCGLAFLTKGFIAFAVPVVAILPFALWEHGIRRLFKDVWVAVLAAVLVSLPWAVLIHLREPDFWNLFFWQEHIKRFLASDAQHKASFWYLFAMLPAAALPWAFVSPAAATGLKRTDFKNPLIRFAICWLLFPFLFFSFSQGKMVTYIMPCLPPLAILVSVGLDRYFKEGKYRLFNAGGVLLALLIGVLAVVLVGVQTGAFQVIKPYAQTWKWVLGVAVLLFWTLFVLFSIRSSGRQKKIALYTAAPALFMFLSPFILPEQTIEHKAPGEFLSTHSQRIRPDAVLISDEMAVCAVAWVYRRDDVYLVGNPGELLYGLHYEDSRFRQLEPDQLGAFILKNREMRPVVLVARGRNYRDWKQHLPEPLFEDSNGRDGFVIVEY
jgi:4-amino-4-deoxy-L-arabinose transferase